MTTALTRIVIVGGGTAGWLSACRLAAANGAGGGGYTITLVEAPDIPTVGVGEGTWPTMRQTLEAIGVDEGAFLLACDASFKQGSRFDGWARGGEGDRYWHPFTPPLAGDPAALVAAWQHAPETAFADAVGVQPRIGDANLAPRQRSMPAYIGALNYAYHLDAGKFAAFLRQHAVDRLGVVHCRDAVVAVERDEAGHIDGLRTRSNGIVHGDLFIDCSGHAALLIGDALGTPLIDRTDVLFNDRALAVHVPVNPTDPIASQTIATAHDAGWIWDIGLPGRRGVGCVYSSAHSCDEDAERILVDYLARAAPAAAVPPIRRLTFRSAHRARAWVGNCLAIGLAAGFMEPLEASAIVMIELSLNALLERFPTSRAELPLVAARFNELVAYRWDRIVEFLKLHYVLSERDQPYWRDHRDPASVPERLRDNLRLWQAHPPNASDLPAASEIFPVASYHYVLYGMRRGSPPTGALAPAGVAAVTSRIAQLATRSRALIQALPTNRAYIDALAASQCAPLVEANC